MADLLELRAAGGARAVLSTRGAALVGLALDGVEVIPSCTSTLAEKYFAGSTLAPWPNRLADAQWQFGARVLSHLANDGNGNANHGLVFDRSFEVIEQSESAVTLGTAIRDTEFAVYPFSIRLQVRFELHAERLSVTITALNEGELHAPIALGSHPYFAFPEGTQLTLNATTVGLDAERMIPRRRGLVSELGLESKVPLSTDTLQLDHEFSGFASTEAVAVLSYPDGTQLSIWQDSALPYQMVYLARQFPWDAGLAPAIAVEPQSAAVDAFHNGLGLQQLAPGDSFCASWSVRVGR